VIHLPTMCSLWSLQMIWVNWNMFRNRLVVIL
jgi:hypothetical protein